MATATKHRSAKQRAASGARFLDKNKPGWFRKIRRRPLDMTSECNCILGQLNGNYTKVAASLGINPYGEAADDDGVRLGFLPVESDGDFDYKGVIYAGPLENAWWDEIKKRRSN